MKLATKLPEHMVPSYSLIGDLLAYRRCRLQYRYYSRSELPPSRPVQAWFGEMLHRTLEMTYHYWATLNIKDGEHIPSFPWPCTKREWRRSCPDWADHDIGRFANLVEESLKFQGKLPRNRNVRTRVYDLIEKAINVLGPHLFPLITSAESKVIATREIPRSQATLQLRASKYEVHGAIDVLTNVTLSQFQDDNRICKRVKEQCPDLRGDYEVIVDYKGSRRPLFDEQTWNEGNWQIQTYAGLRRRQPDSLPVAAGIVIYLNELVPHDSEMTKLKFGIDNNRTDVLPELDSEDEQFVRMWRPGFNTSQLSSNFRLDRAFRVIPVTPDSIQEGFREFDKVVFEIETDVAEETSGKPLKEAWEPNCKDADTCNACDMRWFCPNPAFSRHQANYVPKAPRVP